MNVIKKNIFYFFIISSFFSSIHSMSFDTFCTQKLITTTKIAEYAHKTINLLTAFNVARLIYDAFENPQTTLGMLLVDSTALGMACMYYVNRYNELREPIPMHENK